MIAGLENATLIFNIVFFITLISLLIQGTTVGTMAKWLGLIAPGKDKKEFDVYLPEEIKSSMSEIEINSQTLLKGNRLMDMTLPDNTLAVMVKRDANFFVPKGNTVLKPGDKLLVISDNEEELKKAYAALGIKDYSIEKN